jgi:hypothetical protein
LWLLYLLCILRRVFSFLGIVLTVSWVTHFPLRLSGCLGASCPLDSVSRLFLRAARHWFLLEEVRDLEAAARPSCTRAADAFLLQDTVPAGFLPAAASPHGPDMVVIPTTRSDRHTSLHSTVDKLTRLVNSASSAIDYWGGKCACVRSSNQAPTASC